MSCATRLGLEGDRSRHCRLLRNRIKLETVIELLLFSSFCISLSTVVLQESQNVAKNSRKNIITVVITSENASSMPLPGVQVASVNYYHLGLLEDYALSEARFRLHQC